MIGKYKVIDLFAGPGGLAEGFSSVENQKGNRIFEIALSVEKDSAAHRTLTMRAFVRQFPRFGLPDEYYAFIDGELEWEALTSIYPTQWAAAKNEALQLELGTPHGNEEISERLDELLQNVQSENIVVIGGPPCQAYSLVGRSRNLGKEDYVAEKDDRHFLYREYIRILDKVSPAAFVMENVKGILSSSVAGGRIFSQVRRDLEAAGRIGGGYTLVPMSLPENREPSDVFVDQDFLIRSEEHGVPQARHRVIVLGVRKDVFNLTGFCFSEPLLRRKIEAPVTVETVLSGMPRLRSGLSKRDGDEAWKKAAIDSMRFVVEETNGEVKAVAERAFEKFQAFNEISRRESMELPLQVTGEDQLLNFLTDEKLRSMTGHAARGHMASDLARYFFCSVFYEAEGRSPKAQDFPMALAPDHRNWSTGKFADRFRVQGWNRPASTIVSHISKDGHYFIHPDPTQCRSLTVREAARLQTFPDNYVFCGNRTEQFVQVGNAVPPFLALQIGQALHRLLSRA